MADTFILMRLPFDSEEAMKVNIRIFETIYYAALTSSCELAEKNGPYETYEGSPVSKGVSFCKKNFLELSKICNLIVWVSLHSMQFKSNGAC